MSNLQTVGVVFLMLLVFTGFLVGIENRIIFYPYKFPEGIWNPEFYGLQVEDVYFKAEDGVKLHGWFVAATRPSNNVGQEVPPTLIWFHGNAGNLSHRLEHILLLHNLRLNIFIFDYRGYGKSEGSPDEQGVYLDSIAAYRTMTESKGLPFLYGQSLGGACAIEVAMHYPIAGLILESTFTSAADMARKMFPIFPVGRFLRTKFDSINKIPQVTAPKLFLHGTQDEIVPYTMGRKLFEAAKEPKEFHDIIGAEHNDTYIVGGADYFHAIDRFVRRSQAENVKNHSEE